MNFVLFLDPLELSTAPWDEETHWKQTVVLMPTEVVVEEGDIIGWEIQLEKDQNSRAYKIEIKILDDDDPHPMPCSCGSVKCEIVKHFLQNPKESEGTGEDPTVADDDKTRNDNSDAV